MLNYLIYNERLSESIVQTQVINLLADYNRTFPDKPFRLFIFQNIFFWLKERPLRKRLVVDAKKAGLTVNIFPLALPTRGVLIGCLGIKLHRMVFRISSRVLPRGVLVCRGYLASYLCSEVAPQRQFVTIADPRSLYVRENIGSRWNEGDGRYFLWLNIEKIIVRRSTKLIVVNDAMADYFSEVYGVKRDTMPVVPIYSRAPVKNMDRHRSHDKVRLVYVGSLSLSRWNDINAYRKFFFALNNVSGRIELTLIVKHDGPLIDGLRRDLSHMKYPCSLHIGLKPSEVGLKLGAADIGLAITDPWEDSSARTGIKSVEYLANNLIIWTTKHFGEVAKMVRDTDIGFVFDDSSPSQTQLNRAIDDFIKRRSVLLRNSKELYVNDYSSESVLLKFRSVVDLGLSKDDASSPA